MSHTVALFLHYKNIGLNQRRVNSLPGIITVVEIKQVVYLQ